MIVLRDYQTACVAAIWSNMDKHIVACLPTGAGKTPCVAELIRRILEYHPDTHILLLTHKRELIRQNAKHLGEHLPMHIEIGIFCAGLRSKELKRVTIASVQSIVNAKFLPPFEIIIVDEVHLVPKKDSGQYRKVFSRFPDARIIGVTATPYRMDGGLLHKGEDRLFKDLVYEAKTGDLIEQGWLSPIKAKQTSVEADLNGVHTQRGEFKTDEMIAAMDHDEITKAAVSDVVNLASDRKSILVFCAGVEQAGKVLNEFVRCGIGSVSIVTQKTGMHDRDERTEAFKAGALRVLVNVGCFTTGFDAPNVDCIVLLRATQSPGLYVQMIGRGLRKSEGKEFCRLLDYGGNIERHGPIDYITAHRATSGTGPAPVKTCPQCGEIICAGFKDCPECGFVFPKNDAKKQEHGTEASDRDPVKGTVITDHAVISVKYSIHSKEGKPDSMRVTYQVGLFKDVSEWICVEHGGFAQSKAQSWFARRGVFPMPRTAEDAVDAAMGCPVPGRISVKDGKFPEIIRYDFSVKPERDNAVEPEDDECPF